MDLVVVPGGGHTHYKIKKDGKLVRVVDHLKVKEYRNLGYEIEDFEKPQLSSRMRAYAAAELAFHLYSLNYPEEEIPYFAFVEGKDHGERTGGELMYYFFEKALNGEVKAGRMSGELYEMVKERVLIEKPPEKNNNPRFGSHTTVGNFVIIENLWSDVLNEVNQIENLSNWFHLRRMDILADKLLGKKTYGRSAEELLNIRYERRGHKELGKRVVNHFSLKRKAGMFAFLRELRILPFVLNDFLFEGFYFPGEIEKESPEVRGVI